ncbi:molybdenum cofactor guanylyltransferase protein A [Campylobacter subantarcticus LMG 24377]|uniref:Probable molybdenum cofactor guanylyltransferase n=1 Tax=Campylobacter subantarcticus TaxID=497724 RepID=A0ABW9N335_9BACT|nr:molybdenum cofactor guanylyltransferase [Campylobacter subantarcticus]AJC93323.1 molybdenum cofactor guanylyltransferase protein A [Campylobacter subantarcticus LMG 24377]EAL3939734.1 molybdenum cofactor guanylyltransferase [Campylobacter lari]MPB98482.1 molybdenum cofactor guanylyltransferase [Campylobacter subantarcticus]
MSEKISYPCVILCGGKSSRMGEDKSLLQVDDRNLTLYQYEKMLEIFTHVFISTKENKFHQQNLALILDDNPDIYSPLVALNSILKHFQNTYVFILSVDTPNISKKSIYMLFHQLKSQNILLASTKEHKHYLCGFYHTKVLKQSLQFIQKNNHKLALFCSQMKTEFINFENEEEFINLNYFSEYEKWRHLKLKT